MPYAFDPQIAPVMAAFGEAAKSAPPPAARGDWKTLRATTDGLMTMLAERAPKFPDVETKKLSLKTKDGAAIELRWYTKKGAGGASAKPGAAVVYAHGGGIICGTLDMYHPVVSHYVHDSEVPFLAVEFRYAPEHPGSTPMADTFAAVQWLREHAREMNVDPARVSIMGDSGGGAVAAGVAILARQHKVPLQKQILVYPMLDDRNTTVDPALAPFTTWTYDANFSAWQAVLGDKLGGKDVDPVVAPARTTDFKDLAAAFIDVGELDIFRDEDIEYARQLSLAGVSVELHVYPGAPHAFERLAPDADVSRRAWGERVRVLRAL
jgi:acetyl esterase/lipase